MKERDRNITKSTDCRVHRNRKDDIKQGDHVLVRQDKKNKLSSTYDPTPYVVKKRQNSRVTALQTDIEANIDRNGR